MTDIELTKTQQRLIDLNFTDRVDVNEEVSLFEYGLIRNPKTGLIIYCIGGLDYDDRDLAYDYCDVSLDDVREALEEVEEGYYDFIGSDKDSEINSLENEYLTNHILSLNQYCGVFNDTLTYDCSNLTDLINEA